MDEVQEVQEVQETECSFSQEQLNEILNSVNEKYEVVHQDFEDLKVYKQWDLAISVASFVLLISILVSVFISNIRN